MGTEQAMRDWQPLFSRRPLGVRLGLDIVGAVYRQLGAPAASIAAVHIVGTNGKGSTAALCAHGLARRGLHVGRYTSPHLHRVVERICIDGRPAEEAEVWHAIERVTQAESTLSLPRDLSFFEVLTLAALVVFDGLDLDAIVVEAGLGGRLDATRLVTPVVHAVASIDRDHEDYLGSTLTAIATEKAAVLTRGVPVYSVRQPPEVAQVLSSTARRVGTTLEWVEPLTRPPLGLDGEHQQENGALALAAARVIDRGVVESDLDGADWPGRLESVPWGSGRLLFDVAHNLQGIDVLTHHLARRVPDLGALVLGVVHDKPADRMVERLRGLGVPIFYVPPSSEDSRPAVDGVDRCFTGLNDPEFVALWNGWRTRSGTLCVCGSHRLVGPLRARALGLDPVSQPSDPLARARCFGQAALNR